MTVNDMQSADAMLLFIISACCLIYVAEDRGLAAYMRTSIAAVGFFAFAQAIWLLTKWSPVQAYPWARLCLDAALAVASICRVWFLAISAIGRVAIRSAPPFPEVHRMEQPRRHHARGG